MTPLSTSATLDSVVDGEQCYEMARLFRIETIKFGSHEIRVGNDDFVVLVGPNNVGKSWALRGIAGRLRNPLTETQVVTSVQLSRLATAADFKSHLAKHYGGPGERIVGYGMNQPDSDALACWSNLPTHGLNFLSEFLMTHLEVGARLHLVGSVAAVGLGGIPQHPIHFVFNDEDKERRLSAGFERAFGEPLTLDRCVGPQHALRLGGVPQRIGDEDRASPTYLRRLNELPFLGNQGDGMKSFASVLLATTCSDYDVALIDEPEAFLHPPQALELGRILGDGGVNTQYVCATHSGDFLRGLMDSPKLPIRVLRMTRSGTVNEVAELEPNRVRELWTDSLLRFSNILDGLFHDRVVVCESDSDCRFYSAMLAALSIDASVPKRDQFFTHGGGMSRIPLLAKAMRGLGVPVSVIADFDLLRDEGQLSRIVESLGGNWSSYRGDWQELNSFAQSQRNAAKTHYIKSALGEILARVQTPEFPSAEADAIRNVLSTPSGWSKAKLQGLDFFPAG